MPLANLVDASNDAVTFCIGLLGVVSLWCGLMRIFQDAGGINFISKLISPVIRKLFPETRYNKEAEKHIVTNLTANFLGLGNGATPSGIAAVHELERTNPNTTARKSTCLFLVVNSACLQLVPTTIIALRNSFGAKNPADVLVPIWIICPYPYNRSSCFLSDGRRKCNDSIHLLCNTGNGALILVSECSER